MHNTDTYSGSAFLAFAAVFIFGGLRLGVSSPTADGVPGAGFFPVVIGCLVLIFFSFQLARFAISFGPPEYFALALFGLTMMMAVSGDSMSKGLLTGFAGILLSTVGIDPILSVKRFTMSNINLYDGVQFLPVMIGMFGIGEILNQIFDLRPSREKEENELRRTHLELGRILPTWAEFKSFTKLTSLAALFSTFVGAVPAAGADIAAIISWGQAKKLSKKPEEYGKGSMEGLAVSTVSNNAVLGGALTTMLTLGIPGDAVSAVLIGSLMMYGMQPGPKMFTEDKPFVINIMLLMILANIAFLVIGLLTTKASAKALNVNQRTVWTFVSILCIVGAFALNSSFFDVGVMFAAGLLGFAFKRCGFAPGPFILGLLLGRMLEANLRRALVMSQGDVGIFFTRPVTCVLIVGTVLTFVWPMVKPLLFGKKRTA